MIRIETANELDEATRAALASGRADPAIALFLESVLEMRGLEDRIGHALSGVLLEREQPAPLAPDALARTLAAIDHIEPVRSKPSRLHELIRIPAVLQQAIARAEQGRGWRSAGPGVKHLQLGLSDKVDAVILRFEAGAVVPRHTHKGREATLCLVGGYSDHLGSYGPGDISLTDGRIHHSPKADDDGHCYVLAITDAGLKFDGALGAIQKIFGG